MKIIDEREMHKNKKIKTEKKQRIKACCGRV